MSGAGVTLARWLVTAALTLLCLGAPAAPVMPPAAVEAAEATWDIRQLSPDEQRRLQAGEIVPFNVAERTDRDLAGGVMVYVAAPFGRVTEYLTESEFSLREPGIVAWGALPERAGPSALAPVRLGPAEADELLDARPGTLWNLSASEMDGLRAVRSTAGGAANPARVEAVSARYRALLLQRAQAYRAAGLGGIEPYARRGGAATNPAAELWLATEDARPLAAVAPALTEALLNYPALQHAERVSRFYWIERRLQGRIAPILVHQMVERRPELALHLERHFFVAHTYNSSQTMTGAFPWGAGTLVFTLARVSTDLVTGLGGEVKRTLGRRQLRSDLSGRLDHLRVAVVKAPPPQSP
jgi:hypothetical protein